MDNGGYIFKEEPASPEDVALIRRYFYKATYGALALNEHDIKLVVLRHMYGTRIEWSATWQGQILHAATIVADYAYGADRERVLAYSAENAGRQAILSLALAYAHSGRGTCPGGKEST